MSVTLGANISALTAQSRLSRVSGDLAHVYERLSSGQRINNASDDAAGLAVADQLRVEARIFGVAQRNINDGISLSNIAEASLDQQTNILSRLAELAQESANGTYSPSQRG